MAVYLTDRLDLLPGKEGSLSFYINSGGGKEQENFNLFILPFFFFFSSSVH
jgi:hypothetical protein